MCQKTSVRRSNQLWYAMCTVTAYIKSSWILHTLKYQMRMLCGCSPNSTNTCQEIALTLSGIIYTANHHHLSSQIITRRSGGLWTTWTRTCLNSTVYPAWVCDSWQNNDHVQRAAGISSAPSSKTHQVGRKNVDTCNEYIWVCSQVSGVHREGRAWKRSWAPNCVRPDPTPLWNTHQCVPW